MPFKFSSEAPRSSCNVINDENRDVCSECRTDNYIYCFNLWLFNRNCILNSIEKIFVPSRILQVDLIYSIWSLFFFSILPFFRRILVDRITFYWTWYYFENEVTENERRIAFHRLCLSLFSKVVDKKCNEDHFETGEKVHGWSLERGMHKTVHGSVDAKSSCSHDY